jgi:hypothetical protein
MLSNVQHKVTEKVTQLQASGGRVHVVIFVTDFNRAAANLQWTNGNILFANFRKQLEFPFSWDAIAANHPRTADHFNAAVDEFIAAYFSSNVWERQRTMLCNLTKPFSMTPMEFYTHLQFHNNIVLPILPE